MSPFTYCASSPDYTVVGAALGPTLTAGMLAIDPEVSQMLFSQVHQCRSTEVRSQDCSSHGSDRSGPTVGAFRAAQTLACPNPHAYVPTKSTAAKARTVWAVGALIVCPDVL